MAKILSLQDRKAAGLLPLEYNAYAMPRKPSNILYVEKIDYKSGYKYYRLRSEYHDLVHDNPCKAPDHIRDEHVRQEVDKLLERYELKLVSLAFRSTHVV